VALGNLLTFAESYKAAVPSIKFPFRRRPSSTFLLQNDKDQSAFVREKKASFLFDSPSTLFARQRYANIHFLYTIIII